MPLIIYKLHAYVQYDIAPYIPKTNHSERTPFQKRVVEVIMKWEGSNC